MDKGMEVHLLKYANEFDHFQPECDTWELEKYQKYIHQTPIVNGDYKQYLLFTKKELLDILQGYDKYIGCGFAPAYMNKAGLKLDLYIPYGVGIEYTYRIVKGNIFDYIKEKLIKKTQIDSIKKSVGRLITIDKETIEKSNKYGIKIERLPIPMVYSESSNNVDIQTAEIIKNISRYNYKIFSHVSHFPPNTRSYFDKRNDLLIKGFANFVKNKPEGCNPILIFVDYGEYVHGSKKLITELGIEDYVVWLPLLKRRQLYSILEQIDIGGGELGGLMWGGTGWEFMCKGKPFFQYVDMDNDEFDRTTNMHLPPIFNTNEPLKIAQIMHDSYNSKSLLEISENMRNWFNENIGDKLIEKYIELLKK